MLNNNFLSCTKAEYIILDSLYCGKWEKISKSNRDLDLDRTMPNSSEDFSYPTIYSNFKILDHLFFELSCLQTDRQTDIQTDRQTTETSTLYLRSKPQV